MNDDGTEDRLLTLEEYLALPYSRELVPNEDGSWSARIGEFPGCMATGATRDEALTLLDGVQRGWIASAIRNAREIPLPFASREYSGKFVVRVAPELHRDLARRADREGVSLNQFAATVFARSVGWDDPQAVPGPNGATLVVERKLARNGEAAVTSTRIDPPAASARRRKS